MQKAFTIATPRYYIRGQNGDHFDVFNKRANAIAAAMEFASNFSGVTFLVVKKVFNKEKTIFSIKLDVSSDFNDTQLIYKNMVKVFQSKLNKTKYWRKSDEYGC